MRSTIINSVVLNSLDCSLIRRRSVYINRYILIQTFYQLLWTNPELDSWQKLWIVWQDLHIHEFWSFLHPLGVSFFVVKLFMVDVVKVFCVVIYRRVVLLKPRLKKGGHSWDRAIFCSWTFFKRFKFDVLTITSRLHSIIVVLWLFQLRGRAYLPVPLFIITISFN